MKIKGNISDIKKQLDVLENKCGKNVEFVYEIYVKQNDENLVFVSRKTLKEVSELVDEDDVFLVNKPLFDAFISAYQNDGFLFSEIECKKQKTEKGIKKTEGIKQNSNVKFLPDNSSKEDEEIDICIENHDYDCLQVNKPAVFAIKYLNTNYYQLFYRKSVYDEGTDSGFRKYLNGQPGRLVVYKYFHSVDNLRNEFIRLGLRLRHNGKNELSKSQVDALVAAFFELDFL